MLYENFVSEADLSIAELRGYINMRSDVKMLPTESMSSQMIRDDKTSADSL